MKKEKSIDCGRSWAPDTMEIYSNDDTYRCAAMCQVSGDLMENWLTDIKWAGNFY